MGIEFHHLHKFTEEVLSVMRPRRSLWMILYRKDGQGLMSHPFKGLVIEIDLREFDLIRIERIGVHTESMVLGGDHHPTRFDFFDRLIGSPVAKFQLECPSTKG